MTSTIEANDWGPLAEPTHPDAAGPDDPIWKDNGYLSFWDLDNRIFGTFHVSTSPNSPGARRARCSVLLDAEGGSGRVVEIIEELPVGEFNSKSIDFGLDGTITVDHPRLKARLHNTPLHVPADYSTTGLIPDLVPGKPLQHFQQGCSVTGTFEAGGTTYHLDGEGMRDRTWGFRDEHAQWAEYSGLVGVFDGVFVTAMKFLGLDGSLKADGFVIDESGSHAVTEVAFGRSAAAQFRKGTLTLADGSQRVIKVASRKAGFWVPMGTETDGPAFGAYDDFMALTCDGSAGAGFFEQGAIYRTA